MFWMRLHLWADTLTKGGIESCRGASGHLLIGAPALHDLLLEEGLILLLKMSGVGFV